MKIMILCSGGVRSLFLTALAKKELLEADSPAGEIHLVHVNYGQASESQEQLAVKRIAEYYGCTSSTLDLRMLGVDWKPFKCTATIMHALLLAHTGSYNTLYCGVSADNKHYGKEFSRKNLENIKAFTEHIQPYQDEDGFRLHRVSFEEPLLYLELPQVVHVGGEWQVPWMLSWSCHTPRNGFHCGECEECYTRNKAFVDHGIVDTTIYYREIGLYLYRRPQWISSQ